MLYKTAIVQMLFVDCRHTQAAFVYVVMFLTGMRRAPLHTLFGFKALEALDLFELSSCHRGNGMENNFSRKLHIITATEINKIFNYS